MTDDKLNEKYLKRKINADRLAALHKYASGSILDVGCGNGNYVLELRNEKDIKGVDYQKFDSWDEAPELFSIASADNLINYADNSVDTICCFEVLEHMKDPAKVLAELHRVCRNNVILTVPNCVITKGMKSSSFIYYHYTDPTHIQFFTKKTFDPLVKSAGFNIQHSGFINKVSPLPVLKECFGLYDKPPEHWRVRLVEWVFKKLARKEYHITLLVVAKKANAQPQPAAA